MPQALGPWRGIIVGAAVPSTPSHNLREAHTGPSVSYRAGETRRSLSGHSMAPQGLVHGWKGETGGTGPGRGQIGVLRRGVLGPAGWNSLSSPRTCPKAQHPRQGGGRLAGWGLAHTRNVRGGKAQQPRSPGVVFKLGGAAQVLFC